jgi:glycosyltransferase involved in cell wall biosynthesis
MRVSVIIPSYNHARYIESTIRSVAGQDHPDVEIVVVDDGSTDDSAKRIRRALDEADVSRVLLHEQENAGAHAAIMQGLSLASGPCLTVLNSDDYYLPGRLERVHALAEGREHYLIFTGVSFVDDGSQPLADDNAYLSWYQKMLVESAESPTLGFALLRNNLTVTSGNLVFSRELYDAVGGFRDLDFCHDWDFVMRAARWVEPDFIEEPLMCYRVHSGNASHSLRDVQEDETRDALNRYLDLCRSEGAPNRQAPCPRNWPNFFDRFVSNHPFHFDTHEISHYIEERNRA